MPQPDRKVKPLSQLKNIHTEQLSKLQHKHQQEVELLEDIRLFSKHRSVIEKEYAQALIKLAKEFQSKRKFHIPPDLPPANGKEYNKRPPGRVATAVWKTVLTETEKVGKVRLQAADTYLQQISEPAKPLRSTKQQNAKKVFEQCQVLQKEVVQTVNDMTKTQKIYSEEEHVSHEACNKANEADAKVKNKSTGLFTSLAKLQQQSAKLNNRKEACEVKSTASRNEYLLNLAGANAHQNRYFTVEMPLLIQTLDGEMYESVQSFFTDLAKSELECCGLTQECFMKILSDSTMVSREYNQQVFLHENLVFTDTVQYQFEPQDNDQIKTVSLAHNAKETVEREAAHWTKMYAKEQKNVRSHQRFLNQLREMKATGTTKVKSAEKNTESEKNGMVDIETRIEEIVENVRRAETESEKCKARVEVLRAGGVDVDTLLQKAEAACAQEEEVEIQQQVKQQAQQQAQAQAQQEQQQQTPSNRRSMTSSKSDASNKSQSMSSEVVIEQHTHTTPSTTSAPKDETYIKYEENVDDCVDEAFVNGGNVSQSAADPTTSSIGYESQTGGSIGQNFPVPATALYDFVANNGDELTIKEHEELEVIGHGDGVGWLRAKNSSGATGFVPENYVQMPGSIVDPNEMNVDHDNGSAYGSEPTSAGYDSSTAPTSAGYDSTSYSTSTAPLSAGFDSVPPSAGYDSAANTAGFDAQQPLVNGERTSSYSATDVEVQDTVMPEGLDEGVMWARAQMDYEANDKDELTFQEGQLIKVLSKSDENSVDDGWWHGEVNSKVGVFPSLAVLELTAEQYNNGPSSPTRPGPPSFSPPPPTQSAPQLEITQPSPNMETAPPVGQQNGMMLNKYSVINYYNYHPHDNPESTV